MLRGKRVVATEYRRVVVELLPDDFEALSSLCGPYASPAQYVRLVCLRLAGLREPETVT
jgi:hypothetical protein